MARIFIDSFESQTLDAWDYTNSDPTVVSTSGLGLKGNYCLKSDSYYDAAYKYVSASELYCSLQFIMLNDYTDCLPLILHFGASNAFYIYYSNHCLAYYAGSPRYGSTYVSINTVYFLQLHIKIAQSGGILFSKINEQIDINFNGDTQGSYASFDRASVGHYCYINNVIMDSSEMPENNEIIVIKPNAVGAYSEFNPTPSGNNYTCVDEMPYNDSDFVSSGIVNAVDTYGLEDLPHNVKSIKCVQPSARVRSDYGSTLTKFNFVFRDNLTNYYSDDISVSNNFKTYSDIWQNGPTGSGIWYRPEFNLTELGVRTRT